MRKREIIKNIREKYKVNIKHFGDFDFEVIGSTESYFVKVLNITENHQITVNSKIIWNLKKGKIKGIKFTTISSELINLKKFNSYKNRMIIFTSKPYKILKALNESDLSDISTETKVNDIFFTSNINDVLYYIN